MPKAWDIVAYTYRADTYCPGCIANQVTSHNSDISFLELDWAIFDPESWLDGAAKILGIDHCNEHTFDSDDFPKVVFSSMVEDVEYCAECHGEVR